MFDFSFKCKIKFAFQKKLTIVDRMHRFQGIATWSLISTDKFSSSTFEWF